MIWWRKYGVNVVATVVSLMIASNVIAQNSPEGRVRAPNRSEGRQVMGLLAEYETLLVAMRSLQNPSDEDIAAFERRVVALGERLVASGEDLAAGRLFGS